MVHDNVQSQATGMLEQLKDKAGSLVEKARDSKELLLDIGIYACAGFLIGYFFKKGSRYIVAIIIFAGILVLLQQAGIVNIGFNEIRFYDLIGFQPPAGETTIGALWELIKNNIVIVVSFVVGFLCGIRMA